MFMQQKTNQNTVGVGKRLSYIYSFDFQNCLPPCEKNIATRMKCLNFYTYYYSKEHFKNVKGFCLKLLKRTDHQTTAGRCLVSSEGKKI